MPERKITPGRGANLDYGWQSGHDDDRLDAPSYHRNHHAILDVVRRYLAPETGHALEVGSGSGQHVVGFAEAFPRVMWHPSDPDPRHRKSIAAWRTATGVENIAQPSNIDVGEPDWPIPLGVNGDGGLTAIICINVLHIAPWNVATGLISGAARHLTTSGSLYVYGPFMQEGAHTAPSNAAFHEQLQHRNPEWGIRDIADIQACAGKNGLTLKQTHSMPANNFTLVLSRHTP